MRTKTKFGSVCLSNKVSKNKNIFALASRRVELGMTQFELSERVGVATCIISGWETGRNSPSYHNMSAWAQALGMRLEVIANEDK